MQYVEHSNQAERSHRGSLRSRSRDPLRSPDWRSALSRLESWACVKLRHEEPRGEEARCEEAMGEEAMREEAMCEAAMCEEEV